MNKRTNSDGYDNKTLERICELPIDNNWIVFVINEVCTRRMFVRVVMSDIN